MKINFLGDIAEIIQGITILSPRLGFEISEDGMDFFVVKSNKTCIEFSENKCNLQYDKKIHFFRALGLFIESFKANNNFIIEEKSYFKTKGAMFDVSRNGVLKLSSIKDIIEMLALMGLDNMMLYAEDVYEIKSKPYFGYMRGRYSFEELKECDDYANIFGIEVIPCIQTLAHLTAALKWGYAKEIKDTNDILLVGSDATYEFIEEMIKTASSPFRSKRIHIGMDEAHNLGLGEYLKKNGYKRRFDLMIEHVNKVKEITQKLGLHPMMWSDMYFRIASKTGAYYDKDAVLPKESIENVPDGISLVYWDYYHTDEASYKMMLDRHRQLGQDIIFAGGVWTFNGNVINYTRTLKSANTALQMCKKNGIEEVFTTMWGDDGCETNVYSALLGLQLYAEHGYSEIVDNEKLRKRFKTCTGGDMDAFLALSMDYIEEMDQENELDPPNPTKFLLWQDILLGLFDKHIEHLDVKAHYENVAAALKPHKEGNFDFLFETAYNLASVLSIKADLGLRLKSAYDKGDKLELKRILENDLPALYERACALKNSHRAQWFKTYKPFGFEVLDIRYGGLIARIESVIFRLSQYLNGDILELEELKQERLFFDGPVRPENVGVGHVNQYMRIVSACPFGL